MKRLALQTLTVQYSHLVRSASRSMDRDTGRDGVHNAIVRVLGGKKWRMLRAKTPVEARAWWAACARNEARRLLTKQGIPAPDADGLACGLYGENLDPAGRRRTAAGADENGAWADLYSAASSTLTADVRRALASLSDQDRLIAVGRFWGVA